MSRLSELIDELCPEGVEFKKLGEITINISSGKNKEKLEEGKFFVYGSTGIIGYTNTPIYNYQQILIARVGNAGYVQLVNGEYDVSDNTLMVNVIKEYDIKYMFYTLKNMNLNKYARGAAQPLITAKQLKELSIPVPPLPVQEEIVRILDKYSALETELEEKLEAELEARKQQYEYYREKLLTFDESVERKKLGDIAEVGTGTSNRQDAIDNGKYPFFVRSKEVYRKDSYEFDEEAIIIPGEGGIGEIFHYINGKYSLHQRAYRIHFSKQIISTKFAYYYFQTFFKKYIYMKAVSATVVSIRKPMLEGFLIPIPPLEKQKQIVNVLDKFEKLTTDLTQGIPAEIKARQKQYEFYRNKLLTFKRKTV